jgi:putative endonuclease
MLHSLRVASGHATQRCTVAARAGPGSRRVSICSSDRCFASSRRDLLATRDRPVAKRQLRSLVFSTIPSQARRKISSLPRTDPHTATGHGQPNDARPPDGRRVVGRLGEDIAASHLERRGFAILARNARTRYGEIDIIAFDGSVLAFVEVKTRRIYTSTASVPASETRADTRRSATQATQTQMPLSPLEGLRPRQRARLRRLATAWLQERSPPMRAEEIRFDAIGVVVDKHDRLMRLDHLEGAW